MKRPALVATLFLSFVAPALSQEASSDAAMEAIRASKLVTALRVTEEVTLDGQLDEGVWRLALPATDFYQQYPRNGEPSSERTEVRFLYDADNLYVGLICFDSGPLSVNELKEDFNFGGGDTVSVIIDSLHDRRSAFVFGVNPAGAKRDGQVFNDGIFNQDWDGVWDVRASTNSDGWIAEFAIPFKTLRFSHLPAQEWGLQITRMLMRRNEQSNWSPLPIRARNVRVSLAGTLNGLENIRQGRNLKIKPFVTAGISKLSPEASAGTDYDGGVDAKYGLTQSLTLDVTYRTDFAQVEVDQQQVNLTRFNLFFPEKRDFFLENSGIFNFGSGSGGFNTANDQSSLIPFFSRRIGLSSAGAPIPIIGGARVSGQAGRYDLGFLSMKTDSLGSTPSNNYIVGRVKRNIFTNSFVGAIATSRDSTEEGDYNRVYGADAYLLFFERLELDTYILRSRTPGSSGNDYAKRFLAGWRDNEVNISAEYNTVQTNFNPEAGFVRRKDVSQYNSEVSWRPLLENSDTVRNLIFGMTADYFASGLGKVESRVQDLNIGIQFQNGASSNLNVIRTFDRLLTAFPIRTDLDIRAGDYHYTNYQLRLNTGQTRKITANSTYTWGDFWDGTRQSFSGTVNYRPNYHLGMELNYNGNWVDLPNGAFDANIIGARFIYAFTSRAFFNAFFQYNADAHQFSSNVRFNLIHRPLSDLYLVFNDRRDTLTGQLVDRAFTVKLTNLFNF
jgi:hypothetical protein